MLYRALLALAIILYAAPAASQTQVTVAHDEAAEVVHYFRTHVELPEGLELTGRLGFQDGSDVNLGWTRAGCMIAGNACTLVNTAGAAAELGDRTIVSYSGSVAYSRSVGASTVVELHGVGSITAGHFSPGVEVRLVRDEHWIGYAAWQYDLSGVVSATLASYDIDIGRHGHVRVGLGVGF